MSKHEMIIKKLRKQPNVKFERSETNKWKKKTKKIGFRGRHSDDTKDDNSTG